MTFKPKPPKAPQPRADVEIGDHIYVHHSGQPCAGVVRASGRHGCTVEVDGQHHKVKWDKVLGHKKRAQQRYEILDHGEDGMLVRDHRGRQRFINVPSEARDVGSLVKALAAPGVAQDTEEIMMTQGGREIVLFFKAMTPKRQSKLRALYVHRKVKNTQEIIDWVRKQGFKTTVPAADLHVTQVYSKKPMDWSAAGEGSSGVTVSGGKRSVGPLGDQGAVVLHLESPELSKRWQEFSDAGASWDYKEYKPHITITYDGKGVDLSKIKPFDGSIEFGPEVFESLDEDWEDKLNEEPLTKAAVPNGVSKQKQKPKANGDWAPAEAKGAPAQQGQHVAFRNGELRGHGRVAAAGEHGVTVQDKARGQHRVLHEQITHHWSGDDEPGKAPPPDEKDDEDAVSGYDGKVALPGELVAELLKTAPRELRAKAAAFLREKSASEEVEKKTTEATKPQES